MVAVAVHLCINNNCMLLECDRKLHVIWFGMERIHEEGPPIVIMSTSIVSIPIQHNCWYTRVWAILPVGSLTTPDLTILWTVQLGLNMFYTTRPVQCMHYGRAACQLCLGYWSKVLGTIASLIPMQDVLSSWCGGESLGMRLGYNYHARGI